jgi:hypothetical protein
LGWTTRLIRAGFADGRYDDRAKLAGDNPEGPSCRLTLGTDIDDRICHRSGETWRFRLVFPGEANIDKEKLSILTPIGAASDRPVARSSILPMGGPIV